MAFRLAGGDSVVSCFQALLIAVFGSGIVCHLSSFRSACLAVKRSLIIPQAALSEKMIQVNARRGGAPRHWSAWTPGLRTQLEVMALPQVQVHQDLKLPGEAQR